jgi:lysophospholipase L1-like esterase
MTPAASPEAFWAGFAKLQATVLAGDAERNRAQQAADWPNLCRYKAANATLAHGPRPRAVFMGDSITDNWVRGDPALFTNGIVGRGIGGQTSPQMLARFRQDVVALRPRVVQIMAGTNDVAGNTGPTTLEDYQHNILAMIDLARANDIAIVVAAIPPSRKLFWRGDLDPRPQIRELNEWLRGLAFSRGLTFVDYGMVLADPDGGMRADLGNDGVHPESAWLRTHATAGRACGRRGRGESRCTRGYSRKCGAPRSAPPAGCRIGLRGACAASRRHTAHAAPDTAHQLARMECGGADCAVAVGATKRYVRARNAAN